MKKLIKTNKTTKNFRALSVICACAVVLTSGAGCSIEMGQSADDAQQPAVSSAAEETVSSAAAETEKVGVPKVEGLSVDNAKDILNAAGFQYEIQEDSTSTEKDGTVISQFPVAGDKIEKGSKVTIIVARPEKEEAAAPAASAEPAVVESNNTVDDSKTVYVPDFTLKHYTKAKEYFEERGVKTDFSDIEYNTDVPCDHIISQGVSAGSRIEKGSTISFKMSVGAPPSTGAIVDPKSGETTEVAIFRNPMKDSGHLAPESGYTYTPDNILNDNGACWAEDKPGLGKGAYIEFSDNSEVAVSAIGIWNGYNGTQEQFDRNGKVTKVRISGDKAEDSFEFPLSATERGEQYRKFPRTIYTKTLRITIVDAVAGVNDDGSCDVCISEIIPYQ